MSGVIPKGHQLIFKDELTTELLSTSIYNAPRRKVYTLKLQEKHWMLYTLRKTQVNTDKLVMTE